MPPSNQENLPKWKDWLFRSGLAVKWLIIGCFAFVAASMATPIVGGFVAVVYEIARGNAAFFLIGGLIGAAIGRLLEGPRAGGATVLFTVILATGFYTFEGQPTKEDCQNALKARDEAIRRQAELSVQWGRCLLDDDECEDLSWKAAYWSPPWKDQRPGAVLDRMRARQLDLRTWIVEHC